MNILVVSGSVRVQAAADKTGFVVKRALTVDDALKLVPKLSPERLLFLLQSTASRVGQEVERLAEAVPAAGIAILLPPEQIARFQAGLPFMPRLSRAWIASADSSFAELATLIADATESGRQRFENDGVMAKINARLVRSPNDPARARTRRTGLSERYFTTLLATAPDAFLSLDVDGRILALNDAAADLFEVGDMHGDMSLHTLVSSSASEELAAHLLRARSGTIVRQVELPIGPEPPHAARWIEISLAPVHDDQGRIEGLSATARDVTPRRAAEAELVESRERLRFAMEAAGQGSWELDLLERRLLASPHCRANFGRSPDAPFSYDDLLCSVHPDDQERMQGAVAHSIKTGDTYDIEYRCLYPGGDGGWVHVTGKPIYAEDGTPLRMVGVSSDITARKRNEQELIAWNETLEVRVETAIADREKAQAALRQSQKMEAMGQLTGGVAHDFNNLLTPIIGSLDLLHRRGSLSDREARLIDGALQSAERAKVLVQRLLAFARRQPLQAAAADIGALVSGMADLIASTSGPQIKIETKIAPDLPAAMVDANQLEMAVLNLAVNARDAMPDGGTLTVSAEKAMAPDTLDAAIKGCVALRLSVEDTGVGMDDETAKRSIEPFYSTKGVGRGTGLGLSMVHGLAQQLGGSIAIDSRPGFGTRIDIWLPLSIGAPVKRAEPELLDQARRFHGRALVVDDEPIVRHTTLGMLESMGFETEEAESATEAEIRLNEGRRYDLIVTDHLMPGISGAEFAANIRRTWPGVRVLIVSGYAEVEGIAPDLPRLAKPFREAELAEAISALGWSAG